MCFIPTHTNICIPVSPATPPGGEGSKSHWGIPGSRAATTDNRRQAIAIIIIRYVRPLPHCRVLLRTVSGIGNSCRASTGYLVVTARNAAATVSANGSRAVADAGAGAATTTANTVAAEAVVVFLVAEEVHVDRGYRGSKTDRNDVFAVDGLERAVSKQRIQTWGRLREDRGACR